MIRRVWSKTELKRVTNETLLSGIILGSELADETLSKFEVTDRELLDKLQQLFADRIGKVYYKNHKLVLPVYGLSATASRFLDSSEAKNIEKWILVEKMRMSFLEYCKGRYASDREKFTRLFKRDKNKIREEMEKAKKEYMLFKAMLESDVTDFLYLNDKIVFEETQTNKFYVTGKIDNIPTYSIWSLDSAVRGPVLEATRERIMTLNGVTHVVNPHAWYRCLGSFDINSAWKKDPEEAIIKMIQFTSSLNENDPPVLRRWRELVREYKGGSHV